MKYTPRSNQLFCSLAVDIGSRSEIKINIYFKILYFHFTVKIYTVDFLFFVKKTPRSSVKKKSAVLQNKFVIKKRTEVTVGTHP